MISDFRLYTPEECTGAGGYPPVWHETVKHEVRARAGHRCIRCGHPYMVGESGVYDGDHTERDELSDALGISPRAVDLGFEMAFDMQFTESDLTKARRINWSVCDDKCRHGGPVRWKDVGDSEWGHYDGPDETVISDLGTIEAAWRILTIHHLDGHKRNLRWWNLCSLCQRCHLTIQGKVQMPRVYPFEHTAWFRPYVAGYYAQTYLGEELSRTEVETRLDELLALERLV